jgi:hypothetical protein
MTKPLTPLAFTRGLVEHLCHVRVTEKAIDKAKNFLRERRELRKSAPRRRARTSMLSNSCFDPQSPIREERTRHLHERFESAYLFIAFSHDERCRKRMEEVWERFKCAHPKVDTDDAGHSRRADLFISMGKAGLVSFEFKYLRANRKPAVQAGVRQIRQHLTKHRACVLVLYAATPISERVESVAREIRDQLRSDNGFVVVMAGPPVEFP